MKDRLLENWLNKASERSYQLPFCYLLLSRGETIIHMTRHCGMEHGKDIITKDRNGVYRAYQLKGVGGGRLSLREWTDSVQQQVHSLVHTPIMHPSVDITKGHLSYLVLNGGLEEEVQSAIVTKNAKSNLTGKPEEKINIIQKGDILEMLSSINLNFIPSELEDIHILLRFYLEDGRAFLNKNDFWFLLNSILPVKKLKQSEFNRAVSSCSILCSLALSAHTLVDNHVAVVDGWTIFIGSILRFAEIQGRHHKDIKQEIDLADQIILSTLINLWEEVNESPLLIDKTGPRDVPIYPFRLTIIVGMMAYLASRFSSKTDAEVPVDKIHLFIDQHVAETKVWGESAIPFIISTYWFLRQRGDVKNANALLSFTLARWVNFDGPGNNFFPDVYMESDEALAMFYDRHTPASDLHNLTTTENTLETIVYLCAKNQVKEELFKWWPNISEQIYRDFEFDQLSDWYRWRSREGKDVTRIEKTGHSWPALVQEAKIVNEALVPPLLKQYYLLIPLLLMVYPHRVRRNIVIWYDTKSPSLLS